MIMEIDCLELVNQGNSRGSSRSIAVPILRELEGTVPSFVSFSVRHVGRELNIPAHQCAQRACALDGTDSWL